MQIREKGKKVLCIRTKYDSEKKRTFGVTVARQDKYLTTVSDEVSQLLTKAEVDHLKKWLSDRIKNREVDSLKSGLSFVHYSVRRAAEALSVDSLAAELSADTADKIWLALDELQKALKKAGFKRPAKPAAKAPRTTSQIPLTI